MSRRALVAGALLLFTAHCSPLTAHSQVWRRQQSGTLAWLHAVSFVDDRRGWAVGGKGAMLSTEDGGRTWRAVDGPTEDTLRDIFFVDAQTGWIVCERDLFRLRTNDERRAYLLKTENGGRSWRRVEVAQDDANARLVRVVFADPAHGWTIGEEGAVYATADGGQTWARQRVPVGRLLLGGAFVDARRGILVGTGGAAFHTSDGGARWEPWTLCPSVTPATAAGRPPRLNAVSFAGPRLGWAVGSGGAVYATDGGLCWRPLDSGTDADLLDVQFLDGREGWAVGARGTALHTRDGGLTWTAVPTGTTHTLERVFLRDRRTGWAVGFGGTIISLTDPARR